ncbi:hypothetical protein NYE24_12990 [Paenibacillus sp. FSL H7-0350]|uniref:hypothetical protein n=1 Tax=Paenibacillus sp. FSL H7-0350 TaxID=2975345 RepID=UPI0031590A56
MKRWTKVLIWTLSVVVVLGVGGLFAANYAVDKLMNSMAGGFDVEAGNTPSVPQGQVIEPVVADSDPSAEPAASADPASSSAPDSTPATSGTGDQTTTGTDKPANTAKPASTPAPTPVDGLAHISTDKAKEVQENVTITDKANVAAIVAKQLSVSDIKRLQELAQGGLTTEEKREARSIILGKVTEEQYNELAQIAKKYGVSQGKTRDQILAEEEQLKAQEKGSE